MPAPKKNQNAALPPGEGATSFLYIRCTPAEKTAWVRAARGQPLSEWVRERLTTLRLPQPDRLLNHYE
jgi:hypothetical protein